MTTPRPYAEFLLPADEIESTEPVPASRAMLYAVLAVVVVAVAWAALAEVDTVAVATGRTIHSSLIHTVRAPFTGSIRKIHVRNGDSVRRHAVVVDIDDTKVRARVTELEHERRDAHMNYVRLQRSLDGIDGEHDTATNRDHIAGAEIFGQIYPELDHHVTATLRAHYEALAETEAEFSRAVLDRRRAAHRVAVIDATLPFSRERADIVARLVRSDFAPRDQWLALEERKVEKQFLRRVAVAEFRAAGAVMRTNRARYGRTVATTRERWLGELRIAANRVRSLNQALIEARATLAEHAIRAPLNGSVQELEILNVPAMVQSGEVLMRIVPADDELLAEIRIDNRDIGFIRRGQHVVVKIASFPFTRYGSIAGTVVALSRDAVTDDTGALVYLARVRLDETRIVADEEVIPLTAGMTLTAEFRLGDRRLLEYLLSPFMRYRDEAFRERG